MQRQILWALTFAVIALAICPLKAKAQGVVVELFTSQGCSSCPPADRLLTSLARNPNIITISQHVDYWNYLGWKDPFSKKEFSARQRAYCAKLNPRGVYTPQAVIDGTYQMNGADQRKVYGSIAKSKSNRKERLHINSKNISNLLKIEVKGDRAISKIDNETNSVCVFVTESNVQTRVTSGENRSRTLKNSSVARAMQKKPLSGELHRVKTLFEIPLDKNWDTSKLKIIAIVQGDSTLKIKALGVQKL